MFIEKFNHGVSSEVKKRKWAEITDQVNALGENHREVLITHLFPNHPGFSCSDRRLLRGKSYYGSDVEGLFYNQ